MQKLKYLLYLIIVFIINGCCCGDDGNTYKSYDFYKVSMDKNNIFYLKAKYTFDDENQTFYLAQDRETHQWQEVNRTNGLEENGTIDFVQNRVVIKDKNHTVIYQDSIPTIEDIASSSDMDFEDATIVYNIFGKKYATWNRKQIIASIGTGRYSDKDTSEYLYKKVYNFMLTKNNEVWKIQYINHMDYNSSNGITSDLLKPIFMGYYENHKYDNYLVSPNKNMFCYADYNQSYSDTMTEYAQCIVEERDNIVIKNLYGEVYPKFYWNTIVQYMDRNSVASNFLYFFDKNNNLNLFYNDTSYAKGKYFNYVMFRKDEPTTPKYEQKIERR